MMWVGCPPDEEVSHVISANTAVSLSSEKGTGHFETKNNDISNVTFCMYIFSDGINVFNKQQKLFYF